MAKVKNTHSITIQFFLKPSYIMIWGQWKADTLPISISTKTRTVCTAGQIPPAGDKIISLPPCANICINCTLLVIVFNVIYNMTLFSRNLILTQCPPTLYPHLKEWDPNSQSMYTALEIGPSYCNVWSLKWRRRRIGQASKQARWYMLLQHI